MPLVLLKTFRERMALSASRTLTGAITSLALLMAVQIKKVEVSLVIAFLVTTLASLVLTRFFSEMVQLEINEHRLSTGAEKWELLKEVSALFYGGIPAVIFLGLAGLGLMRVHRAIVLSRWSLIGILFLVGFLSREWAGASKLRSFFTALTYTAAGLLLVFIRYLVSLF